MKRIMKWVLAAILISGASGSERSLISSKRSGACPRALFGTCGDITIIGGTVEAWGGYYAAGIGSGQGGRCGNITINNTVTKVTAWHNGTGQSCCIGRGEGGSSGKVKIGDTVYKNGIFDISFTYQPGN